jgi:hypothetical protein
MESVEALMERGTGDPNGLGVDGSRVALGPHQQPRGDECDHGHHGHHHRTGCPTGLPLAGRHH